MLAKKALNHPQIEINLALSKAEFKRVISIEVRNGKSYGIVGQKEDIFSTFRSVLEMRGKDLEVGRKMS